MRQWSRTVRDHRGRRVALTPERPPGRPQPRREVRSARPPDRREKPGPLPRTQPQPRPFGILGVPHHHDPADTGHLDAGVSLATVSALAPDDIKANWSPTPSPTPPPATVARSWSPSTSISIASASTSRTRAAPPNPGSGPRPSPNTATASTSSRPSPPAGTPNPPKPAGPPGSNSPCDSAPPLTGGPGEPWKRLHRRWSAPPPRLSRR